MIYFEIWLLCHLKSIRNILWNIGLNENEKYRGYWKIFFDFIGHISFSVMMTFSLQVKRFDFKKELREIFERKNISNYRTPIRRELCPFYWIFSRSIGIRRKVKLQDFDLIFCPEIGLTITEISWKFSIMGIIRCRSTSDSWGCSFVRTRRFQAYRLVSWKILSLFEESEFVLKFTKHSFVI